MSMNYNTKDPIIALSTPWAESALAVIRLSGESCIELTARCFSRPTALINAEPRTVHYGKIRDVENKRDIDEVMISVFKNPQSYTGQDSCEICCHGNLSGIRKILDLYFKNGFREALPGEFTFRAFMSGKMDLTRAEAVNEIIKAKSGDAQAMALNRLSGAVEGKVNQIKQSVLDLNSALSILLDYPEDEAEEPESSELDLLPVISEIRTLLDTYSTGKCYQEGVTTVLAGRTNAGKSSLFNLFLKEDRSIVSEIHGTTRDYLESWISLEGIPVKLFDTAGIRTSNDPIEKEGIKRTGNIMNNADIILYVISAEGDINDEDRFFIDKYSPDKLIIVRNKIDLGESSSLNSLYRDYFQTGVSATTGIGFRELEKQIRQRVIKSEISISSEPVIDSIRQKILLEKALKALEQAHDALKESVSLDMIAVDFRESLDALGEITGEITSTDILENMFSRFCVGK